MEEMTRSGCSDGSLDALSRVAKAFGVPVRDLFVAVAVATDVVPNVAIFSISAYWVAGWLLSMFLFLVVHSSRLDRAYPSSRAATDEVTSGQTRCPDRASGQEDFAAATVILPVGILGPVSGPSATRGACRYVRVVLYEASKASRSALSEPGVGW
jgi:hypothetical protein